MYDYKKYVSHNDFSIEVIRAALMAALIQSSALSARCRYVQAQSSAQREAELKHPQSATMQMCCWQLLE